MVDLPDSHLERLIMLFAEILLRNSKDLVRTPRTLELIPHGLSAV